MLTQESAESKSHRRKELLPADEVEPIGRDLCQLLEESVRLLMWSPSMLNVSLYLLLPLFIEWAQMLELIYSLREQQPEMRAFLLLFDSSAAVRAARNNVLGDQIRSFEKHLWILTEVLKSIFVLRISFENLEIPEGSDPEILGIATLLVDFLHQRCPVMKESPSSLCLCKCACLLFSLGL